MVEGIRERGITVVLVEHDMRAVMRISRLDRRHLVRLEDRRGQARGDPRRRGGDRGLSRPRTTWSWGIEHALFRSPRPHRHLRQGRRAARGLDRLRRGPDRLADRRQRRRQVDDAPRDHRPQASRQGRDLVRGRTHRPGRPGKARRARHRHGARGPTGLPAHERPRQSDDGRPHPQGQGRRRVRPRAYPDPLPASARASAAECRHALGRRAGDARHRPRADGEAEAPAPRRAVARARAARRPRHRAAHPRDQSRRRRQRHPRRAELADGTRGSASTATCSRPAASASKDLRPTSSTMPTSGPSTSAAEPPRPTKEET